MIFSKAENQTLKIPRRKKEEMSPFQKEGYTRGDYFRVAQNRAKARKEQALQFA